MKWGTKFEADYVNRLFRMVSAQLTLPHRFVCFTDDSKGIDKRVEVFPIPELYLPSDEPERCWKKLTMFSGELANLSGPSLFLDLDIVIRDSIDDFFKVDGDFRIIKDWDFPNDIIGNSSVFRFNIGDHNYVLENFLQNRQEIKMRFRNEQAYLSHAINEHGNLKYWDLKWCVSFKRHCLRKWPVCYFKEPIEPVSAKIVVFHGKPTPNEASCGYTGKLGFRYIKPTNWIRKYVSPDKP
ncbi:MAG: hypothetical protein LBT03_03520 [Holosporales bacterium]|jgi:hypothetical protein|nr:hypothetical protein [Holosporales bacterium]